jgi:hypothetical protein
MDSGRFDSGFLIRGRKRFIRSLRVYRGEPCSLER